MLDAVFVFLSRVGTLGLIWIAVAVVASALSRRPLVVVSVVGATTVADLTAYVIKVWAPRERPPVRFADPHPLVRVPADGSFPSGHAATSFAGAALLAWSFPELTIPAFVLAAGIAWSRVYVGVHYPLDVVGGALLGLAVAIAIRRLTGLAGDGLRLGKSRSGRSSRARLPPRAGRPRSQRGPPPG